MEFGTMAYPRKTKTIEYKGRRELFFVPAALTEVI